MPLDKFRAKLVIKILYAGTPGEAERFIKAAVNAMKKKQVNGYIISRFIDRILNQLSNYQHAERETIRRENVLQAKMALLNIRDKINPLAA